MYAVQEGYHLNIAINLDRKAWDHTPEKPRFDCVHFAAVFLGDTRGDTAEVLRKVAEFQLRFKEGNQPGEFKLSLTEWRAGGQSIELPGHVTVPYVAYRGA